MLPLVVDYRDHYKRINKWGRLALIGAAVSTFISAASQYFELQKGQKDAQDALARTNTLLAQVKRVLNPLKDLSLGACIEVPLEPPELSDVSNRLEQIGKRGQEIPNVINFYKDKQIAVISDVASIAGESSSNQEVYHALADVTIEVSLIASKETLEEIERARFDPNTTPPADLEIGFLSGPDRSANRFIYREHGLFTDIQMRKSDPTFWKASGAIRSIEDLQNAVLMIRLRDFVVAGDRNKLTKIRSTFVLKKLTLSMTDGRAFEIQGSLFRSSRDKRQQPRFLYRFPANEEQFPPTPKFRGVACDEQLG
jgi:hypothetical protein